ncbi:MAG: HPr family phosphocarrier protein [Bacteroidetes bacterium]|jgi:phosphocarrier protein HPr|nr:HPr family phosphocarrier protein [Bacteroidota bacterium]MBT4412420.1 HPr family phosphocarrier protein [Bacteroidota bacterium]MBT7462792.1 HPr family phosphocarrier protein [Bacteroidota bacterium]
MVVAEIVVTDEVGLHARTASLFAKKAMLFNSEIKVEGNQKIVNGKSMLSLMSLGIKQGTKIEIFAEGKDEVPALKALRDLVGSNFKC